MATPTLSAQFYENYDPHTHTVTFGGAGITSLDYFNAAISAAGSSGSTGTSLELFGSITSMPASSVIFNVGANALYSSQHLSFGVGGQIIITH